MVTGFGWPYDDGNKIGYRVVWSLFPPDLLAHALKLLGDATATPEDEGMSWSERGKCAPYQSSDCWMTIVCLFISF